MSAGGPLRAGIIGTGMIGAIHARAARLAGARIVAVAASSPERSAEAATRLGAERVGSAEEVAEAPDVDVVHVCTPNALHRPLAAAAMSTGHHVVCEKPLATDRAGAEALARQAASIDVVAAVPFVYRFYPTVREARERVRNGDTGAVRLVHGSYLQDWLLNAEDGNWRVDAAAGGSSRAFADIGSHWCDLAQFVTGQRITRLSARTKIAIPERPGPDGGPVTVTTEDAVTLLVETDGGAMGSAVISQISPGRKNRLWLEVDGARAAVAFDQEAPETLWRGARDGMAIIPRDPEAMSPAAARYAVVPPGHPQGYADCFDAFVADVYAAVRGEGVPDGLPTFADGLAAARITEAVLASAGAERWVDVPDGGPPPDLRGAA